MCTTVAASALDTEAEITLPDALASSRKGSLPNAPIYTDRDIDTGPAGRQYDGGGEHNNGTCSSTDSLHGNGSGEALRQLQNYHILYIH